MNILVTGGLGYKGSVLVPKLLNRGHNVIVYDIGWFGNYLPTNNTQNLRIIVDDILNINNHTFDKIDSCIHLASIANDPSTELNESLSWNVSCLGTRLLCEKLLKLNTKHIIYASSGSVYGIKPDNCIVNELESLNPISIYNKVKMCTESIINSYADKFSVSIFRPATVCGYSPRMRLDVAVNMLTYQAIKDGKIKVLGGEQFRPNVHIEDITNLYVESVENNHKYIGTYNVGFEDLKINEIAKKIQMKTNASIEHSESNDPRSYRMTSDKIIQRGFIPKYNVDNAIESIIDNYKNGKILDDINFYTVKKMLILGI